MATEIEQIEAPVQEAPTVLRSPWSQDTSAPTTQIVTPEPPVSQEPVVETPAPATDLVTQEPATEPVVATTPEPQIVEKVVEKIVEKYPEFKDEKAKALYEAWTNGELDAVKNYIREIDKNYDTMAHVDVVREGLKKDNPAWSAADVELELRTVYGNNLEPYNLEDIDKDTHPDEYKEAVAHNREVERNMLKLERDARDFRIKLKEKQQQVELPKLNKEEPTEPAIKQPTEAELDAIKQRWAADAEEQVQALSDFKFQVGDDKNPEEVAFVITPEEKRARVEAMKTWGGAEFMQQRGWMKEDGSFNILNIAKDVHALENMNRMIKSAFTQGVTAGKKETIAKDIKNVDLEHNRASDTPVQPISAGQLVWGSRH